MAIATQNPNNAYSPERLLDLKTVPEAKIEAATNPHIDPSTGDPDIATFHGPLNPTQSFMPTLTEAHVELGSEPPTEIIDPAHFGSDTPIERVTSLLEVLETFNKQRETEGLMKKYFLGGEDDLEELKDKTPNGRLAEYVSNAIKNTTLSGGETILEKQARAQFSKATGYKVPEPGKDKSDTLTDEEITASVAWERYKKNFSPVNRREACKKEEERLKAILAGQESGNSLMLDGPPVDISTSVWHNTA